MADISTFQDMSKGELVEFLEKTDKAKKAKKAKEKIEGGRVTRMASAGGAGGVRGILESLAPDMDIMLGPVSGIDLVMAVGGSFLALGSKGSSGNVAEGVACAGLAFVGRSVGKEASSLLPGT
jgi:hypothetical protein